MKRYFLPLLLAFNVAFAQAPVRVDAVSDHATTGQQSDIASTTYGANGGGIMHVRGANGTIAQPRSVPAGMIYGGFGGRPCVAYSIYEDCAFVPSSPVSIHWIASENQTPSNLGGSLRFLTTPNGSNIRHPRLELTNNGTVWVRDENAEFNPADAAHTRPSITTRLLVSGATGIGASVGAATYGWGDAGFRAFTAGGSPNSPQPVTKSRYIGFIGAQGYDGQSFGAGSSALVGLFATENWSPTAKGSSVTIETTKAGSTVRKTRLYVNDTGVWFVRENGQVINLVPAQ